MLDETLVEARPGSPIVTPARCGARAGWKWDDAATTLQPTPLSLPQIDAGKSRRQSERDSGPDDAVATGPAGGGAEGLIVTILRPAAAGAEPAQAPSASVASRFPSSNSSSTDFGCFQLPSLSDRV